MSKPADQGIDSEVNRLVRQQTADLLRSNAALRDDRGRLMEQLADSQKQTAEARTGRAADRASRLAALNLMEDAVAARKSEQRENAERRRAEEALREADRRKDEFLAMLGHELRNPLAAIKGGVQLLQVLDPADDARVETMSIVAQQIVHMERLIEDVLDVARITQGKIEIRTQSVVLQDVVQMALHLVRETAAKKNCVVDVAMPEEAIWLKADSVRIAQVFTNILNNALKYSARDSGVELTAGTSGDEAFVAVRDRGAGISAELLPYVFEPFVQASSTLDRSEDGLGLGLHVVQMLVASHGGRVEAASEGEGCGSEFTVHLPFSGPAS